MPFQLSPGVAVVEKDFTSIVPAVSSSIGAAVGAFPWGPVMEPITVSSENDLVARFGKPNDSNFDSFFTAANFLSYTNNLLLVRADAGHLNAVANRTGGVSSITIGNAGSGYSSTPPEVTVSAPDQEGGVQAVITATVSGGVVSALNIVTAGTGYSSAPTLTIAAPPSGTTATATATVAAAGVKIKNGEHYTTNFVNGAGVVGSWAAKYPGSIGNSIKVSVADSNTFAAWAYKDEFDAAPDTSPFAASVGGSSDEMHIIIIDEDGAFTGTQGAILEKFPFVSKGSDAKKPDGTNNYYKDVINSRSQYIWWMDHLTGLTNAGSQCAGTTFAELSAANNASLSGGTDDYALSDGEKQNAFALLANSEQYDLSLVMAGKASATVAEFIINDICETRLDCVAFISPQNISSGDVIIGSTSSEVDQINAYRNELPSTSYAVMDSGYKYQYDRYNDKYRWVPLNGDVAGLCARTDFTNDPWFSPSGLNRGQIKNVVRLAVNPNKTQRDTLYKNGVNPVVTFPGEGTVLFGDKTLLAKPSAFDRINVRRLFIVMEKAIATAAKFQLFEFNDSFTRAQFKNLVEPFLRDVQGRRGITDFVVKCDESNNTGEVIDRNEFVADIFVKPNRSINFITLTFVAARSAINFTEIGA
jgi:phage tail sheath protein FI